ncbi:MAG: hypothetical protein ABIJ09_25805 [Pseudomonadota bacterium]
MTGPLLYRDYNREERALCFHLMRLLFTRIDEVGDPRPVDDFLAALDPEYQPGATGIDVLGEVALIRDAYHARKEAPFELLDAIVELIREQEGLQHVRPYTKLPEVLRDPRQTHPGQICRKATSTGMQLSEHERLAYGALQGMFNAKPDLAVVTPSTLYVVEAKFTEALDATQLDRTRKIGEVWQKLLPADLGYAEPPRLHVATLAASRYKPDMSWQQVVEMARRHLPAGDRSLLALERGLALLQPEPEAQPSPAEI